MRLTTHTYKYEETCEMISEEGVAGCLSGNEVGRGTEQSFLPEAARAPGELSGPCVEHAQESWRAGRLERDELGV